MVLNLTTWTCDFCAIHPVSDIGNAQREGVTPGSFCFCKALRLLSSEIHQWPISSPILQCSPRSHLLIACTVLMFVTMTLYLGATRTAASMRNGNSGRGPALGLAPSLVPGMGGGGGGRCVDAAMGCISSDRPGGWPRRVRSQGAAHPGGFGNESSEIPDI